VEMPKTNPTATQETTPLKDIYDLAIHLDELTNKMKCYYNSTNAT
jgi:hypothetical protein